MIVNGRTEIPTGGTAVPLSAVAPFHYGSITITADAGNAGVVVVGGATGLVANAATRTGFPLAKGESITIEPGERGQGLSRESTNTIWVNSETGNADEGVSWMVQS